MGRKQFDSTKQSAEFNNFNLYSDSTLKSTAKDELIKYIHMLHYNWSVADERAENMKKYAEVFLEKEFPKKPVYKADYTGDNNYFCQRCANLVPFTLNRTSQIKYNFCPYCGQRLDWSDDNG